MRSNFELNTSIVVKNLQRYGQVSQKAMSVACEKAAIQFLAWSNTGTGKTSKKPPIRTGVLRGSSSAFVGGKLVSIYSQPGMTGEAQPARSGADPEKYKMTWAWNTSYAKKMHEWRGNWGKYTRQDADAGSKWATANLLANNDAMYEMIADELKQAANGM